MSLSVLDTVAFPVYALCAVTSLLCAVLLLRSYRSSRVRLLLWSGLCFVGFCVSAVFVIIDLRVLPTTDLSVWRSLPSVAGLACLLYGMIMDGDL
jgi:hypothetical protein